MSHRHIFIGFIVFFSLTSIYGCTDKSDTSAFPVVSNAVDEPVVSPAKKIELILPVGLARLELKYRNKEARDIGIHEWKEELQKVGAQNIEVSIGTGWDRDPMGVYLSFSSLQKRSSAMVHGKHLMYLLGATPVGERLMYFKDPMKLVDIYPIYG